MENERATIIVDGKIRTVVIPVAGFMYRRIVSHIEPGDEVFKGQCLGRILYGSVVMLLLPDDCEIMVKTGQKVKAGKTIVAKIKDITQ